MAKVFKTAIFDLDGTLIDSKRGITEGLLEAFKLNGITLDKNVQIPVGPPLYDTIIGLIPDISEEKIYEIAHTFRKLYPNFDLPLSKPFNRIVELLTALKENGVETYIATYKPKAFSEKILLKHFYGLYKDVITPTELPTFCDILKNNCTKSDIVKFLIQKHNIDPNFAFMAGDAATDIQAAADNELLSIAINYGFGGRLYEADIEANTPDELFDIILKLTAIEHTKLKTF